MIRVTVELIPRGDEARKKLLAKMEIENDGKGDPNGDCSYNGVLFAEYVHGRKGRVERFNRKYQSVWTLIGAFLKLWGHTKHPPKYLSGGDDQLSKDELQKRGES